MILKKQHIIFNEKLGYIPKFFHIHLENILLYMKNYISKNFDIGFGQHSGDNRYQ